MHLFGIWDGHGINGKNVSEFIKVEFPKSLAEKLEIIIEKDI